MIALYYWATQPLWLSVKYSSLWIVLTVLYLSSTYYIKTGLVEHEIFNTSYFIYSIKKD